MKLTTDETYTDYAAQFLHVQVDVLNGVLKEHGVKDAAKRREICIDYFFEAGMLVDQCGLKMPKEKPVYPVVCFSNKPLHMEPETGDDVTLHLPDGSFEFHGYTHGTVGYYFDENKEKLKGVKVQEPEM